MLNNSFVTKSVGTLTLGEKLKKIRSDRRVSLGEISRVTRIPVKYLEYLDAGNYEKLPVDVYVKGFLRSYAEYLGIDEKILIRLYEKEKGIRKNLDKDKPKEKPRQPISVSYFAITPRLVIIILMALLLGGGLFYLYKEIGSFSDAPRLIVLSPENNSSISDNSVSIEGLTDSDAKIFINDQPIPVNDEGRFQETVTLQSGANPLNIKAINRFNKETLQVVTVQADYEPEIVPAGLEAAEDNRLQRAGVAIEISVSPDPVWLSVETDGNLVFSGTLPAGTSQSFNANEKITISSGRGNATFIKLNGRDIGALNDSPEAVRGITFTPTPTK